MNESEYQDLVLDLQSFNPSRASVAIREQEGKVVPDALFLARRNDVYLGYTCLNVAESDQELLIHGWTGVRPEYRGKGLATALKLWAATYAKQQGYERIVTSPRRTNAASLRANAKVGFRPKHEPAT
jgi:RimJ/RimL family protein N-acetyltransferase